MDSSFNETHSTDDTLKDAKEQEGGLNISQSSEPIIVFDEEQSTERGELSEALSFQNDLFYEKMPLDIKSSVEKEINSIEFGPKAFIEPLSNVLSAANNSIKEGIHAWQLYLENVRDHPFFGQRTNIIKFFTLTRKLRLLCYRIDAIITAIPYSGGARKLLNKLLEFLISILSNSPIDSDRCEILITVAEELLIFKNEVDVGPHNTIKFIRFDSIFSIIKTLKNIMIDIKKTLLFTKSINNITKTFNRLFTDEFIFKLLPEEVPLNFAPRPGPFDNKYQSIQVLSGSEMEFIGEMVEFLAEKGIRICTEVDKFSFDSFVTPNLVDLFTTLTEDSDSCRDLFSENFRKIIYAMTSEPITEALIFEALSEVARTKFDIDFREEPNEKVDELFEALKTIHTIYNLMTTFDFFNIAPFTNTTTLIYVKTFASYISKREIPEMKLFSAISQEIISIVKEELSASNGDAENEIKTKKANLRRFFIPAIHFAVKHNTPETKAFIDNLLAFEEGDASDSNISSYIEAVEAFENCPDFDEIREFYNKAKKIAIKTSTNNKIKKYTDFLSLSLTSFKNVEGRTFADDESGVIVHILNESILACIDDETLYIKGGYDESLFLGNPPEEFTKNFAEFNKRIAIKVEKLNEEANKVSTGTLNSSNDDAKDSVYCVDAITRGDFSRDKLVRFICDAVSSDDHQMVDIALKYINLWRFFTIRDEIARGASVNEKSPEQSMAYSIQRHFNMKCFLKGFSGSLLYLYTACGTTEEIPINVAKECITMRNLADDIPLNTQVSTDLVSSIDCTLRNLRRVFESLDMLHFIAKIENFLITSKPNHNEEILQKIIELLKLSLESPFSFQNYGNLRDLANKFYSDQEGSSSDSINHLISYINTISMHQHMISDINAFIAFLISSKKNVHLVTPFFILSGTQVQYLKPFIPMQIGVYSSNPEFTKFCVDMKKAEFEMLVDEDDIIDVAIAPPDTLHDVEVQNKIASALKREISTNKEDNALLETTMNKDGKSSNEFMELVMIKQEIQMNERQNQKLQKNLEKEIKKSKMEFEEAKEKYNREFRENDDDYQEVINDLNIEYQRGIHRLESKKEMLMKLKNRLMSMIEVNLIIDEEMKFQASHRDISSPEVDFISEIPTSYTPYTRAQTQKSERSLPQLPVPILSKNKEESQKSVSEVTKKSIDLRETFEMPKMTATPSQLQSIIGEEWPENMEESVSKAVRQISSMGGDSKVFLSSFKD